MLGANLGLLLYGEVSVMDNALIIAVMQIRILIGMTVMRIRTLIGKTVMRIATVNRNSNFKLTGNILLRLEASYQTHCFEVDCSIVLLY